MPIPGIVPVTGTIGPTDVTDIHATLDPFWGIDGLRSVADLVERDAITTPRRRYGMAVFVRSNGRYYQMQSDLVGWTDWGTTLGGGGGSSTSKKDLFTPTLGQTVYILSQTPSTDSMSLILNGVELTETIDYTISGVTLTLSANFGPGQPQEIQVSDTIVAKYLY